MKFMTPLLVTAAITCASSMALAGGVTHPAATAGVADPGQGFQITAGTTAVPLSDRQSRAIRGADTQITIVNATNAPQPIIPIDLVGKLNNAPGLGCESTTYCGVPNSGLDLPAVQFRTSSE